MHNCDYLLGLFTCHTFDRLSLFVRLVYSAIHLPGYRCSYCCHYNYCCICLFVFMDCAWMINQFDKPIRVALLPFSVAISMNTSSGLHI